MQSNNQNSCSVCHLPFTLALKKKNCSSCKKPVCKFDLLGKDSQCYSCLKSKIYQRQLQSFTPKINSLKHKISNLKQEREEFKKRIEAKENKVSKYQKQLEANKKAHKKKIEGLKKRAETESSSVRNIQNVILSLKSALETAKTSEKEANDRILSLSRDIQIEQRNQQDFRTENSVLLNLVDKLKFDVQDSVEASQIKTLLCGECYQKAKKAIREHFATALRNGGRESLLDSVLNNRASIHNRAQQNKNQAPFAEKKCCRLF